MTTYTATGETPRYAGRCVVCSRTATPNTSSRPVLMTSETGKYAVAHAHCVGGYNARPERLAGETVSA